MRNIYIADYDAQWIVKFEKESKKLKAIFGDLLIEIHHVGSTSIPNMPAKPVIDMMPIVHDISQVDDLNPAMIKLGYEPMGENNIAGRRYFRKGGAYRRSHHVHAYEPDNPEVAKHLDFRDYMIHHPDDAQDYAEIKHQAAKDNENDIYGYMDAKHDFIQEMIANAQAWRKLSMA